MKLYIYENIDEFPQQKLIIDDNKVINLTLRLYESYETTFNIKTIDTSILERNIVYTVCYTINGYYHFLVDDQHEPSSQYAALRFYLSNTGDIYFFAPIKTEVLSLHSIKVVSLRNDEYFNFRSELERQFPEYRAEHKKRAEHDMLHDLIDANYSCSCLDAQLDLLTKIVFNIIDKNPEIFDTSTISDFQTIRTILENTSLLKIKDITKIIQELSNKEYIRNLQKEYYKLK